MSPSRTVLADVGLIADGSHTEAPDTTSIHLEVAGEESDFLAIDFDLDLGIAGQSITISVPLRSFAVAVRSLAPMLRYVVGEVVVDIETGARGVVRQVLDHDLYEIHVPALGTYRRQGAYLVRPRTMEQQA